MATRRPPATWTPSTGRRVLAILISAVLPGAGHVMLGRVAWAVLFLLLPIASMAVVPQLGLAAALAVLGWRLVASVHVAFCPPGPLMPTGGAATLRVVLLLVAQLALTAGLRRDVVENVTMLDGAMTPTLETGDYLVVDKTAYGIRLPFSQSRVRGSAPVIGELVAFDDPDAPEALAVARLVARAPSRYALAGGELIVDGQALRLESVPGACEYREVDPDRREWVTRTCARAVETVGGVRHEVHLPLEIAERPSLDPRELPAGTLLVADDNRRGTPLRVVREDSVRGRVKMVWLSTAGPGGVRWDRTGFAPR